MWHSATAPPIAKKYSVCYAHVIIFYAHVINLFAEYSCSSPNIQALHKILMFCVSNFNVTPNNFAQNSIKCEAIKTVCGIN